MAPAAPLHREVTGIVLAGGLSRRMGGGDKGLRELAGKPMLAHVLDRLRPQVGRLAINANGDPARFAAFGVPVVPDTIEGFVGPLAGVLAGMRWSAAHAPRARWIATAAGDAPLLPADLVARLMAAVGDNSIALAQSNGDLHPVIGLWPVALADDLEAQLRAGVRKVLAWTDRHGTTAVAFPPQRIGDASVDPFFNANTPEELDGLRAMLVRAAPMTQGSDAPPVIGIVGWKKSGKTTLVVRLIEEFTRRGLSVATVKHAHHAFQIDDGETDSARHRRAGAVAVAIVSAERWALVSELKGAPEPALEDVIARLGPRDLILVEGYKAAAIPKIEVRRTASVSREPLAATDPHVIAIAADFEVEEARLPVFALDDVVAIADFIIATLGAR
jgi:molybdenum cofactor guanylyltransferase/molybdopterin-guanine dinucleotide biosynthesis protein MobB